ncbi:MAG: FAD-dependent oxidoreductase [Thermosynechococcaceae cyanobacterium]
MAVDYNLVVVGATPAAETAAIAAAQAYARVAWVPGSGVRQDPLLLLREGTQALAHRAGQRGPHPSDWRAWASLLETTADSHPSPSAIQAHGVDYLEGPIAFQMEGTLGLTVGSRQLRSRAYLLAIDPDPTIPKLPGLDHPRVWTLPQLWIELQRTDLVWPQHMTVYGSGPQAIELSQSLRRLGVAVLILTDDKTLLPHEDPELAFLLRAYLEGDGIEIATGPLHQVDTAQSEQLVLTVGDRQYVTGALAMATETATVFPTVLKPLNLRQTPSRLWVNAFLQTSHPQIYACGTLLGGYRLTHLADYEARLAVQNALFAGPFSPGCSRVAVQYRPVPYAILSHPPLARVGLTESQAQLYNPEVQTVRQTYKDCDRAFFTQAPAGLCKVLVQPDGRILGAHLLGTAAEELIHVFALAIQQAILLPDLADLNPVSPAFAAVIQQTAQTWRLQQLQRARDRNEGWFYRQRQRTR